MRRTSPLVLTISYVTLGLGVGGGCGTSSKTIAPDCMIECEGDEPSGGTGGANFEGSNGLGGEGARGLNDSGGSSSSGGTENAGGEGGLPSLPTVTVLPLVVHIIHQGEPVGTGTNLSDERIMRQIEVLNEDFRRKEGTRGFNAHPDGGDAGIEFVLASVDPDGAPTSGITRTHSGAIENPIPSNSFFDHSAYYQYWSPDDYVNVWTLPLAREAIDVFLGSATGPETDLPGVQHLVPGEPEQAEGIVINAAHFGESDLNSEHALGRTLTHEMGHYRYVSTISRQRRVDFYDGRAAA